MLHDLLGRLVSSQSSQVAGWRREHALRWVGWLHTTYIFVLAVSDYAPRFHDIGDEGFLPATTHVTIAIFLSTFAGNFMVERYGMAQISRDA